MSFRQCCRMRRYNKIFTNVWWVYSLLCDTYILYRAANPHAYTVRLMQLTLLTPQIHFLMQSKPPSIKIIIIGYWQNKFGKGSCAYLCLRSGKQLRFFTTCFRSAEQCSQSKTYLLISLTPVIGHCWWITSKRQTFFHARLQISSL